MKRILQFKKTDAGYACFEGEENVFEISKANLQFDVKAFYQAFYSEDKDFENIEVQNCISDDRDAERIYDCIIQLMTIIKKKLDEILDDSVDAQNVNEISKE